jgi:hypothetical protein
LKWHTTDATGASAFRLNIFGDLRDDFRQDSAGVRGLSAWAHGRLDPLMTR